MRPILMTLAAAAAVLIAQPASAGVSAQYGADDPHLDRLAAACSGQLAALRQALEAGNPPEIVEVSTGTFLGTLRGSAGWTPAQIAERQSQADALAASGAPVSVTEAAVTRCVLREEQLARAASD